MSTKKTVRFLGVVILNLFTAQAFAQTHLNGCDSKLVVEEFRSTTTNSSIVKTSGVQCMPAPLQLQQGEQQQQCQQQQQQDQQEPNRDYRIDENDVKDLLWGEASYFQGELYICGNLSG